MSTEPQDFGSAKQESRIIKEKSEVNPYDIFRLAKRILLVAAGVYLLLALIRIFYPGTACNPDGVKEVWEYSKVFLNSIVSLVLGLYFGSSQGTKYKTEQY
jgi:hypothetical protein